MATILGTLLASVVAAVIGEKRKRFSFVKESGSENVALSTIRENIYVVKD